MKPLVSVITPIYNGEETISYTIESVLNQTLEDLELIIVDDLSEDNTEKVVKKYQEVDKRIKYFKLKEKGGASGARNFAINKAEGRYVAFLDGDDLWYKDKLEKQVNFMKENDIAFSYTDYEYIDDDNKKLNVYRESPRKMSYFRMLLGDSIGCLTVMYDREKVGKISIPNIKKRNDYALWCVILRKVKIGYKYDEILSMYRKTINSSSLSSGKKYKLLKYHYQMHREINNLSILASLFYTVTNVLNYLSNRYIREKKIKNKKVTT